ncbi:uncharacterized protein [Palaemon carinicauda]|uniref:uncharacterized protein n=1 Tax=Palaemon carinicauda TaxID=392227 RepID=UPI0035B5A62C
MSTGYTSHENIVRVIEGHKIGLKTKQISEQTGVKPRTIRNILAKYRAWGGTTVPIHSKSTGRSLKVSERTLTVLKREAELHPTHSACKFKEENSNILGNVAVRTVRKYLSKNLGFKKVVAWKKPLITAKHKVQRKDFVKEYGQWGVDEWKRVLFSDEDEATFLVSSGYCSKGFAKGVKSTLRG